MGSLFGSVGGGLQALEHYVSNIPPVTRAFVFVSVLLSLLDKVADMSGNPQFASVYYPLVRSLTDPADAWRLVTSSAFFGKFGIRLFYSLYYLVRTSTALETGLQTAPYANLLGLQSLVTAVISAACGFNFVAGPLLSALVYQYSLLRPEEEM